MDIASTALCLEALGSETRLQVFRLLVRAGPDGLPVGELQQRVGAARSTLSHHLHRLIAVGLVSQRREGTTLHCCADFERLNEAIGFLSRECCVDAGVATDAAA